MNINFIWLRHYWPGVFAGLVFGGLRNLSPLHRVLTAEWVQDNRMMRFCYADGVKMKTC